MASTSRIEVGSRLKRLASVQGLREKRQVVGSKKKKIIGRIMGPSSSRRTLSALK
jgi:hypothetical protein